MTPGELILYLQQIVQDRLQLSLMIWGPPGVGKSSIVAQVAHEAGIGFVDVRLSQLAPTDLRGLPVAVDGISRWYPPEFLPQEGEGILFMDEINMAPPAMQGVAQQLVLDRKVGSYTVPEGWLIWAAGNRKEDRAAVYDMPAPLGNRFVHLEVEPDFDSFKAYALRNGIDEQLMAFLSYRPVLLHQLDPQKAAWPSPRSWMMANTLHRSKLAVAPAVGVGPASEFDAFLALYQQIPDLQEILKGSGKADFPSEPSACYAVILGLTLRCKTAEQANHAFNWLMDSKAGAEWVQLFAGDLFQLLRERGEMGTLARLLGKDSRMKKFLQDYKSMLGLG
jgi:hypothetical protein